MATSETPRFIDSNNSHELSEAFVDYASKRMLDKANERKIGVKDEQLKAVKRMFVTTDILEAAKEYQKQRKAAGNPASTTQLAWAILSAPIISGACYFSSQSRSIPLEQFTPIIYVNPVLANIAASLVPGEIPGLIRHEVEHAVDDVLGIYMGASKDANTSIWAIIGGDIKAQFGPHEIEARKRKK